MKQVKAMWISKTLSDKFAELPLNRSAATTQALMNVKDNPSILADALRLRIHSYKAGGPTAGVGVRDPNDVRVNMTLDSRLNPVLLDLSERSGLSVEEVIRLAMEAYIHKL